MCCGGYGKKVGTSIGVPYLIGFDTLSVSDEFIINYLSL